MKKTILIIVILLDSLLLIACGKNELGTINELSFEIPKTFSNCEKNESQYSCTYKNNTNFCSVSISNGVSLEEKDAKKSVKFLLYVNNDVEIEYSEENINGYIWTRGYVKNDGNGWQKTLYLINDYNGSKYQISYDCTLNTDLSSNTFKAFVSSLKFN